MCFVYLVGSVRLLLIFKLSAVGLILGHVKRAQLGVTVVDSEYLLLERFFQSM
jgi:hypothetical protein